MTRYLVCKCGWKSKAYPDDAMFMGVGGQLSCPTCTRLKINRNIEVYGSVEVVQVPNTFNPSKRENKKLKPFKFYCRILNTEVDEEFCGNCSRGKLAVNIPNCYWRTATEEKSSDED